MSGMAALFVCLQWWEMHTGSVDTHNLAVAAGKQADRMKDFSDRMKEQSDRTKDLAARMQDQAASTKDLAAAAKDQAEIVRRQFASSQQVIESQRANIGVSVFSVDHPITFGGNKNMSFAFTLALANNGAFVANDVRVRYKLYFSQFGQAIFTEPRRQQRTLCKAFPTQDAPDAIGNMAPKLSIYPGRAAPEQINGGWGFVDQDVVPRPNDAQHPIGLIPIVVGCIDYLSGTMPRWHQTGFIFEIRGKNRPIVPGIDVSIDSLTIDRYIFDQGESY
jgi:hypothetical protein